MKHPEPDLNQNSTIPEFVCIKNSKEGNFEAQNQLMTQRVIRPEPVVGLNFRFVAVSLGLK